MGKFINALLNKQTIQPSNSQFNTRAATGQPVPVAMAVEPVSDLSSGSSLNRASSGWAPILDGGMKYQNGGWRNSTLREVSHHNTLGNYGSTTSQALFGFRYRAYAGIGNGGFPIRNPYRQTYNELTPVVWGARIPNPNTPTNTTAQKGPIVVQSRPSTWLGSNTASLKNTGETLL